MKRPDCLGQAMSTLSANQGRNVFEYDEPASKKIKRSTGGASPNSHGKDIDMSWSFTTGDNKDTRRIHDAVVDTGNWDNKDKSASETPPESQPAKRRRTLLRTPTRTGTGSLFQGCHSMKHSNTFGMQKRNTLKQPSHNIKRHLPLKSDQSTDRSIPPLLRLTDNMSSSVDWTLSPRSSTSKGNNRRISLSSSVNVTSTTTVKVHCEPRRNLSRLRDTMRFTPNKEENRRNGRREMDPETLSTRQTAHETNDNRTEIGGHVTNIRMRTNSEERLRNQCSRSRSRSRQNPLVVKKSRASPRFREIKRSPKSTGRWRSPGGRDSHRSPTVKNTRRSRGPREDITPEKCTRSSEALNSKLWALEASLKSEGTQRYENCPSLMSIDTSSIVEPRPNNNYDLRGAVCADSDRIRDSSTDDARIVDHNLHRRSHRDIISLQDIMRQLPRDGVDSPESKTCKLRRYNNEERRGEQLIGASFPQLHDTNMSVKTVYSNACFGRKRHNSQIIQRLQDLEVELPPTYANIR